jgi:hypothetical protein
LANRPASEFDDGSFKDFHRLSEKVLLRPADAAIEYERYGRDAKRYVAQFAKDPDLARALFGYNRSESRRRVTLLGDARHKELLRLVRRRQFSLAWPALELFLLVGKITDILPTCTND